MSQREFKGWETELSPECFNLLSILTFRRSKSDFSFDKSIEHTAISTFASYVAKISKDEEWIKAASTLSGALKETEVNEAIKQKEMEIELATVQFAADNFKTGNDVHMIQNRSRTEYVSNLHARKRLHSEFSEYEQNDEGLSGLSTPPNKIRISSTDVVETDNSTYSDESSPIPLTDTSSQQSDTNIRKLASSLTEVQIAKVPKPRKYIDRDIANEVLNMYQTSVLPGEKLMFNGVNILDSAFLEMKQMKKTEMAKSPLNIRVINFHNLDCTRYIPHNYINYIADQLQDQNSEAVNFAYGKKIDKFIVDCDEQVLNYLDKFYEVGDLETLGKCLTENHIDISTASNDLIYVQNLFHHFFFLFKNDFLTQNMSEYEFNSYIWTPLLRNAFLGKSDLKLNYGELAPRSYEKLKGLLDIGGRSAPKLDGKGFLKSLGTEILAQEDGVLDTRGKRKGDLQKLEYCSKIILTALFIALPSSAKVSVTNIETYSIQSNGFRLTISASKYLFEDIIITMDLQDVEVPRTIKGFSNLVMAVKVILSWKARTRRNTMAFYEALKIGHKRITNGVKFSPKKISLRQDQDSASSL
ncbi:13955_t:CDS:2 [Funneliformis caledonium]|uniref:13955_t:CDS:1 n=1 Tax=Funneliformis caledonium TaxID=1117310 RepID=A0A9N9H017_9GLOM|nr:13955_t:CDS:2 [Funneliformis caledonium]